MMKELTTQELQSRIHDLESRLEESEQLINAIKAGEVDAFAIGKANESEIYTLQSGDYAYRILIEKFGEGAMNVTEDGLIVYTNSYFCKLLGMPYDKVIGSNIAEFVHKDSLDHFNELFQSSISGGGKGEINMMAGDTVIPVFLSLTSLQPKLPTVGIIVTDYTEKKKTEDLILDYQKNLEHNNHELKENNAELESFVYIASHDLQEPLRKIQTFASIIREREKKSISETGLNYFHRMESAANRMQTLIKDLLTYSRTNNLERIFIYSDLGAVLQEVKIEMSEELQEYGAIIEQGEMCHAHIIPFQFKQLLINLISNSLKFARKGIDPHVLVSSKMVSGNEVERGAGPAIETTYCHIRFEDNGIGFQEKYADKIFELFQRVHGNSELRGTGIGLAIVKKIVDNHEGIIRASSVPGEGSTFDIYIPERDSNKFSPGSSKKSSI
jgi:PAS domain S-box-containing protein